MALNYDPQRLLRSFIDSTAQKDKVTEALERYLQNVQPIAELKKTDEIPFSSERKFSAVIFGDLILVLGAAEVLLSDRLPKVAEIVKRYTSQSYRVVVFGYTPGKYTGDPTKIKDDFEPQAVVAIEDPVRPETKAILEELSVHHIGFKIISGDSPETVSAVAHQINSRIIPLAITQSDMEKLTGKDFDSAVLAHNIFARIKPQTKQAIIKALKANDITTVMVGDGVNDVLAIKEANLGIAMNGGSAMAKEVADVVLLNNSFSTLPLLLYEGKKIVINIQNIADLYLIKNISSILSILLLGYIGLRFPFDPKHVELASLLIIGIPSVVLALDKLKSNIPVDGFVRRLLLFSGAIGFINALLITVSYVYYDITSEKLFYARSIALMMIIFLGLDDLVLIYLQHYTFVELLRRKLPFLLLIIILLLFSATIFFAPVRDYFAITPYDPLDIFVSLNLSLIGSIIGYFMLKRLKLLDFPLTEKTG